MDQEAFSLAQRALAEPKRIEILETIRRIDAGEGTICASVLAEMSISQATFSHHVSELQSANLITAQKEGRCVRISVNEPVVLAYVNELKRKFLGPA
jgi:DNA-binding transcriptional ArsR family regulator